jgi:2-haloacid dehalogenase
MSDSAGEASVPIAAVVFDIGRVLFQWDLRHLYAKLIADRDELEWFVTTVVTHEWHYQHDAGRGVAEMVAERQAEYPDHAELIAAWGTRFNESIPGPVPGSLELVEELHARGVPLFAITNFGDEFWSNFHPTQSIFERFGDVVVSGVEKIAKPDVGIYRLAESRFGLPGKAMLFIDDNADNVAAARAEGWHAHHFLDAEGLAVDLRERGLIS